MPGVSALRANSSNNTLFADSSGNIAYLHPQFVPLRDDRFDYRGVVDGSDPRTAWRGGFLDVRRDRVALPDGTLRPVKLIGVDADSDLALLKIDPAGLKPIEMGDPKTLASSPAGRCSSSSRMASMLRSAIR